MKKSIYICFFLIVFIIILLLNLSGCINNNSSVNDKKDRIKQELDYLDTKIIEIANELNNISLDNYKISSEQINMDTKSVDTSNSVEITQMKENPILSIDKTNTNSIDWESIKSKIEIINESWSTIIIDLTSINVNNEDLLGFSSVLNDLVLSISNNNKKLSLINISKLYGYLPRFEKYIDVDNKEREIKEVKAYILNAYSLLEKEDWNSVEKNIKEANNSFINIMNDVEYMKDNEYKINNTYVLINELKNSLQYRNKELFYIRYKNLIESLNAL